MDGVRAELLVARDRDGHAEERGVSEPEDQLDLLEQVVVASRDTPYDRHRNIFLQYGAMRWLEERQVRGVVSALWVIAAALECRGEL